MKILTRKRLTVFWLLTLVTTCTVGTQMALGAKEPNAFFTVTIILPTNNLERLQFAEAISTELAKIGINVNLEMKTWAEIGPRIISPYPYDEGGFDICFYGMETGALTGHPGGLLKTQYLDLPPEGANVMRWAPDSLDQMNYLAAESEDLITSINENMNYTEARDELYEWQRVWYDALPNNMIYSQSEVFVISKGLLGFDPLKDPFASLETQWTNSSLLGNNDTIVLAGSYPSYNFNAMFQGSLFESVDRHVSLPPLDSLIDFTPSNEILLPIDVNRADWMQQNFNTTTALEMYPRVASDLGTYSPDGLTYNITVRDDVLWHDGHLLDAWDVAFSFQAYSIFEVYEDWLDAIGPSNQEQKQGVYSFIVEDKNNDSFFEHISFQFVETFAPFESEVLNFPLFPEHILGDPVNHGYDNGTFSANLWISPPGLWESHSFNTGNPSDIGGLEGPIGCGSTIFKEYNHITREITLQKFENIQWNNASGEWVVNNSNDHFLIETGKLVNMPTYAKMIFQSNRDTAVESMKTGEVNILDPLFTHVFTLDTGELREFVDELQLQSSIEPIVANGSIYQAMFFNPNFEQAGIRHLNLKGVRHAISHMIPRLEIIDQLLNGFGTPSYSPLLSSSWATVPEGDLLDYKRTVKASDGTKPEENATTAYDMYSIKTALRWLKTEGYDVSRWEVYHGFAEPKTTNSISLLFVLVALFTLSWPIRKRKSR